MDLEPWTGSLKSILHIVVSLRNLIEVLCVVLLLTSIRKSSIHLANLRNHSIFERFGGGGYKGQSNLDL